MKSIVIIGDGMSDRPQARLQGKTPLMAARKPAIDRIAREGRMGLARTIGETGPADSAVANLAVLGYDAPRVSQGRAVLEAASMGVEIRPGDVALRCNLITLAGEESDAIIRSHSAGHISNEEAAELIRAIDAALGGGRGPRPARFHPGVSYRHLLVLEGGWASPRVECAPPHDHLDGRAATLMPRPLAELGAAEGDAAAGVGARATRAGQAEGAAEAEAAILTAARLNELYERARPILAAHPVNARRRVAGREVANSLWFWSPGRRPSMPTLAERFGVRGAVISAVDLVMGLGVYAGLDLIRVPGATGLHDTNYEGKAEAALRALEDHDFVYVHVEATDEASHARDLDLKIRCIEYLDDRLVRHILAGLESRGIETSVAILPDHPTPVETGRHARDPVPVAIRRPGVAPDGTTAFDEEQAARGALGLLEGEAFIRAALGR
ncbi:MAG: 2,3-bisphosphoglycerate-independent phosphoglycerate mutase [Candidatus Eisenbacteria bacterium]|uniref:2,3-bisphosphoglycerate-independent phosphoglycerate mutase n=1 Tax=Eiseniibacteriota bacterium TaxID=2212470 RepID=A0A937X8G6_UNCEI|nr:2,3-bisphosphoglycerate-independent phosphoglycerate mutase [Candidatus Eisenbacteria bacterium]